MIVFLTGCQAKQAVPKADKLGTDDPLETLSKNPLPETEEEWESMAAKSDWYEKELPSDAKTGESFLLHLTGDDNPEAVMPYYLPDRAEGPLFGLMVGTFDEGKGDWSASSAYQHAEARAHINAVAPVGMFRTDDGKEMFVLGEEVVSGSTINHLLHVFRLAEDGQTLIRSAEFTSDYQAAVEVRDNQLTYQEDGQAVSYELRNSDWLIGNGYYPKVYLKKTASLYDEPFMTLLDDHPARQAHVDLSEGYGEAKARLGEPQIEADDLGGICAQYKGFNFCNDGQSNRMVHISLQVEPTFTIEEVKRSLGEPDEKILWDIQGDYYLYNYELGAMTLSYSTENADPESRIDEVLIIPKNVDPDF